ncbi:MAG: hypothetical protein ACXV5K_12120, partial [Halobacteriota archaeon]
MASLDSRAICALILSFIVLTDVFIILDVPVLRQVSSFALLTFLPGFLIIRMLQFGTTSLEKTLFTIGLSVSFLFFVPLVMIFTFPILGISRPISLVPLATTFSVILGALSLAAYKKGSFDVQIKIGGFKQVRDNIAISPVLGAALIVIIGVLGGLSAWFFLDSIFLLVLGLSIAVVVVLLVTNKISPRFYPLYLFAIAIGLLYSRTLASPNLFGTDAMYELYFANLVKGAGVWDPSFSLGIPALDNYYVMLSVSVLPTVYSILLNISTVWVFKLIYSFIFACVPLGLYAIFRTHVKSTKSAFLAAFLFASYVSFYGVMPIVTRQELAEFFFVLAILLIVSRYPQTLTKAALLLVFITSLAVSHYTT